MTNTILASAKTMSFIITRDRPKSVAFYRDVLGFKFVNEDNFAAVFDMNGTMLRISTVKEFQAQTHTVLGWDVPDIAAAETRDSRFQLGPMLRARLRCGGRRSPGERRPCLMSRAIASAIAR